MRKIASFPKLVVQLSESESRISNKSSSYFITPRKICAYMAVPSPLLQREELKKFLSEVQQSEEFN